MTTWGLVATIKAPAEEVLRFAAYHLEAGAHRLFIYLDDDNPAAFSALKAHPKCRVMRCDVAYWAKQGNRPQKHQVRQSINATHAYRRLRDLDWLIHIDADEFLVAKHSVADRLARIPPETSVARVRPMEALSGEGTAFKTFIPPGPERAQMTRRIYPTYGDYLKGGFLSHLAGKVFVRSGLADVRFQIHNVFLNDGALKGIENLSELDLAHLHAKTWEEWYGLYRYRLSDGSYRAVLAPNRARDKGGISLHQLFSTIEAEDGTDGLRAFFDEVCADSPDLRARLAAEGMLKEVELNLAHAMATHFPNVTL